jgi:tetratricopeptide (TPR) repeat protein
MSQELDFLKCVFPAYLGAGFFGGLINGLNPPADKQAGSSDGVLVSGLTGAAASIAVLIVVVNMLEKFDASMPPKTYLSFWSVGMVSGFMGMRFLNLMSDFLGSRLGEISRQMGQISQQNRALPLLDMANTAYRSEDYNKALTYYNRAIQADPESTEAKIGKAKCLYYLDNDKSLYKEALSIVDNVLAAEPDNDHALYQQAAILLKLKPAETKLVLDILEKADRINPAIGKNAQTDPRFSELQANPRFTQLAS